jgi:hypothetical protein
VELAGAGDETREISNFRFEISKEETAQTETTAEGKDPTLARRGWGARKSNGDIDHNCNS